MLINKSSQVFRFLFRSSKTKSTVTDENLRICQHYRLHSKILQAVKCDYMVSPFMFIVAKGGYVHPQTYVHCCYHMTAK